jgi:site-specific DNA-methyltransferase (adenine-specific)
VSRVEHIGNATLILGDCRDVLPTLGEVDAVVADPPFGIGFKYESHDDTPDGYGEFIWAVISRAEALCSPGSPLFVWQAMPNALHFSQWFPRPWRIYAAAKNFVQMRPTAMQYAYDPVLVWWTDGQCWAAGTASRDFHVADSAPRLSNRSNLEKGHPCPRPLDQVSHIVEQWCRPNGIVLDPFMGSGTAGVACSQLGRRFIGIEIEPRYFDIACRRIEDAQRQGDLIRDVLPRAKQDAMDL